MNSLSIGLLSKKSGTSVATLRYYEQLGLIQSRSRLAGETRYFLSDTECCLEAIRMLQELGFTLREIRALAKMSGSPAARCRKFAKKLGEKLDEIQKSLAAQARRKDKIKRTLRLCEKGDSGLRSVAIGTLLGLGQPS
jgi:MerR family copper efflux transcriptional regulator